MIGDAEGVVALTVEFGGHSAEVSNAGQGDKNEAGEEVIHGAATQCYLTTDGLTLAEFEV